MEYVSCLFFLLSRVSHVVRNSFDGDEVYQNFTTKNQGFKFEISYLQGSDFFLTDYLVHEYEVY